MEIKKLSLDSGMHAMCIPKCRYGPQTRSISFGGGDSEPNVVLVKREEDERKKGLKT